MLLIAIVMFGSLLLLLGLGLWIGPTLLVVGMLGIELFANSPVGLVMATTVWGASTSWTLTALPLFIWMGEILYRSSLPQDLFSSLSPWMNRIPGRLLHVNILGCSVFALVSGSSAATALTVGKISLPELRKRGYDESMSIGTLSGSGTLGLMIPPSIMMIVYGVAAEVSIAKLFMAGILPGLALIGMFMLYVMVWAKLNPHKMPAARAEDIMSLREKLVRLRRLMPMGVLILAVVSSIYTGVATPTEAAAVGVAGALCISWFSGNLNRKSFLEGLRGAMVMSCMMTFILACAAFMANAMGFTGLPKALASGIGALDLSPFALLALLTVFYLVLGCFLDGISLVVLTTSVVMPLVAMSGFDLIWFGVYVVLVCEMSQITPPVGFNLFALQSLTGHNILMIAKASAPFFLLLLAAIALIAVFPELVLYLPNKMNG